MNFFPGDHSWQEERGNAFARAKRLVSSSEKTILATSELTGIDYQELLDCHKQPEKLYKADWKTVDKLARAHDYFEIVKNMPAEDTLDMQDILENIFSCLHAANSSDLSMLRLLARLQHIVTTDPIIIYELFKAYKD